jgi:hypothetical protein
VGERVTFTVTLTVTGDTPVTGVTLVDTYEHAYLRFVSSAPGGCISAPLDAGRSQVMCALGDLNPASGGAAGSVSRVYMLTFDALAPVSRTVDCVVAQADLDGTGPATPASIGPACDGVPVIGLPLALPNAGDGEVIEESFRETTGTILRWVMLSAVVGFLGGLMVAARGSRI